MKRYPNKKATLRKSIGLVDIRMRVLRDPLPYEELLRQDNGNGSCRIVSDVDLLFNQHRLDRMSKERLFEQLENSVCQGDSVLANLRKNVPDNMICQFVKSRYIQSLSELRSWSQYLMSTYNSEYAAAVAAQAADPAPADSDPAADN